MAGWRDEILREFTPGVAPLTVAADPDGLLLEAGILEAFRARGFEVTSFEDLLVRDEDRRTQGRPDRTRVAGSRPGEPRPPGIPVARARRWGFVLPARLGAVRRRRQPQSSAGALPAGTRRRHRSAQGDG